MIRRGGPHDAAAVRRVHAAARASWDFEDPISTATSASVWAERLAGDEAETHVAERDGAVVGFVSFCAVTDEDLAGRPVGEVLALYVDPAAHGGGAGSALLEFALQARRTAGDEAVVLWTYAGNHRGRRFYERRGFVLDVADGDELRYRREL